MRRYRPASKPTASLPLVSQLLSKKKLLAHAIRALEADLAPKIQRERQTHLTAPVDGIIQQLAIHTTGGVVTSAQPLMIVVPDRPTVTADAVTDEKKGSYYPATLTLSQKDMLIDGKRVNLSPGMNITAEIKTGQRRIIEFLLSPVQRAGSESLRER